jgi:hypothetical protein
LLILVRVLVFISYFSKCYTIFDELNKNCKLSLASSFSFLLGFKYFFYPASQSSPSIVNSTKFKIVGEIIKADKLLVQQSLLS